MSCGASPNRRVYAALNRRSVHVGAVATQTSKHKAVAKPVKRKSAGRPATKKPTTTKKRSEASLKAAATARKHAQAKARATARAHAQATARAHARATARRDAERNLRAEELACHNKRRRSAAHTHVRGTRTIVTSPLVRAIKPAKPPKPPRALKPVKRLAAPLDPDG